MSTKEKIIKPLMWNAMFEVVFDNNIEVIISLINDCCGTSYQIGIDNIKVNKREIPRKNMKEIGWVCDFIVTINTYDLYNIEINKRSYTGLDDRNWNYILKLHSSRIPAGTTYNNLKKYKAKQLNFNKFKSDEKLAFEIEGWSNYTTNKKKHKNIGVFQFDIEFCYNIVYNESVKDIKKVPKLYRWGAIFIANSIEKIDYILGSDMLNMETKKDLLNRIEEASTDEIVLSKISLEEDFEGSVRDEIEIAKIEAAKIGREEGLREGLQEGLQEGRKEGRKEGHKEGLQQGIEQGIEKNIIDTIKAMLNNNLDINLISKITNKTENEILKIKENIDISN